MLGRNGEGEHFTHPERVVRLLLLPGECLPYHVAAYKGEQHEGDPVVEAGYVFLKGRAEEITDKRHERLKSAEPEADDEHMLDVYLFGGKALADRDGECVHGEADRNQKQL